MKSVDPGSRLGTVILMLSGILAIALFPVAFLHGPYCTVNGPATDTLPEQASALLTLLFLICVTVTAVLRGAPEYALQRIALSSRSQSLEDRDRGIAGSAQRRC